MSEFEELPEWLRTLWELDPTIARQAEKNIESADAEVARLREALAPFARFAGRLIGRRQVPESGGWYSLDSGSENEVSITIEDFELAREALKETTT